jgi:hypothetical protein
MMSSPYTGRLNRGLFLQSLVRLYETQGYFDELINLLESGLVSRILGGPHDQ